MATAAPSSSPRGRVPRHRWNSSSAFIMMQKKRGGGGVATMMMMAIIMMMVIVLVTLTTIPRGANAQKGGREPPRAQASDSAAVRFMKLPEGFSASLFVSTQMIENAVLAVYPKSEAPAFVPRMIAVSNRNNIFYFSTKPYFADSTVVAVECEQSDAGVTVVKTVRVVIKDLINPHGLASSNGHLWVATVDGAIYRYDNADDKLLKQGKRFLTRGDARRLLSWLPKNPDIIYHHTMRAMTVSNDGNLLYIPISTLLLDPLDGKFAYIFKIGVTAADGTEIQETDMVEIDALTGMPTRVVARGIRSVVGMAFDGSGNNLYWTDNSFDAMEEPPEPDDELNVIRDMNNYKKPFRHYGYPVCYAYDTSPGDELKRTVKPAASQRQTDIFKISKQRGVIPQSASCDISAGDFVPPIQVVGPHAAPLGLHVYERNPSASCAFPQSFAGNIFIATHGSGSRSASPILTGHDILAISVNAQSVVTKSEQLVGNMVTRSQDRVARPVDVDQLSDGSLVFSDDYTGAIYKISYGGCNNNNDRPSPSPSPSLSPTPGQKPSNSCMNARDRRTCVSRRGCVWTAKSQSCGAPLPSINCRVYNNRPRPCRSNGCRYNAQRKRCFK